MIGVLSVNPSVKAHKKDSRRVGRDDVSSITPVQPKQECFLRVVASITTGITVSSYARDFAT